MKRLVLIALLLVLIDQITKFYLESSRNFGAAFGILEGYKWLFLLVGIFVLGFLYYYREKVGGYGFYGLVLMVSGVTGNLIDRLVYGYVRDFIDLGFFPSFNFADAYNTVGVVILVVYFWKK